MKKIKLLALMEDSFTQMLKMKKNIWIIAIIISFLSGGFLVSESFDTSMFLDGMDDTYYEEEYGDGSELNEEYLLEEGEIVTDVSVIILAVVIGIGVLLVIGFVILVLASIASYYLYKGIYEIITNETLEKAPLVEVIKVNLNIALKTIFGFIFFIIPGIIIGIKYAPANYVLVKNPQLSSKEVLAKTRELSKGFKWKIFIFNCALTITIGVVSMLGSINGLAPGYIVLDVLNTVVLFIIETVGLVYLSIFNIKLFKIIENIKSPIDLNN